ncbi:MAG: nucleotidyltransferase family protein [Candidatus Odinarchaeota archaeon]|nr:nucleotidyltransferase family protein [Candidatus Odinarchaeota archaeon]
MITLDEIKRKLSCHKEEIKKRYNVKELRVFGSFVRGEEKETSDIDILVEFEETPDLLKFIELERFLEELLGIKVDLVRKEVIRPELKTRILREALVI